MLRSAVIGCGFMGELHCKTYHAIDSVEFAGVYDIDGNRALEIATKYRTKYFPNVNDLLGNVDIASIAVPTLFHYDMAIKCINKGINMLMEKPLAANLNEAYEIVKKAQAKNLINSVGYIERFNPSVIQLLKLVNGQKLLYIETERHAPLSNRANDVSVVFDLLIHDIDIILSAVKSDVADIKARGYKRILPVIDDVVAQLYFKNGVIAKLSSRKNADKKSRIIKIRSENSYFEADLIAKTIIIEYSGGEHKKIQCFGKEPIMEEILDFISAVENKTKPCVSFSEALKSLEIASNIEAIAK